MALSGNAITNDYNGRYYEFTWSATQDIATNKSTITWELYAKGNEGKWYAERTLSVSVNGTSLYSKTNRVERYDGKITGGSFSLTHDSAGNCSFTIDIKAAVYVAEVNLTRTKTTTLNQIPRQATLTSAPNFTDAVNPTIKYSNPAGSAVSALEACISLTGSKDDIPYRAVSKTGTSYTFNLTTAELNTLKNATTGNSRTVYFYLKTTIGSNTYYSYLAKTFTISDTSISFSGTGYDSNSRTTALTGNNKYIVKGYSNLYYSVNATSASGSISSFSATCAGRTLTSNTGTFYGATSADISFKATDNRGNTATANLGGTTLINYFKPTLQLKIIPTTTSGDLTLQISGTFFNQSFGKVKNTLTCRYSISHEGSGYSSGSSFDLSISGNSYSGSITISGLDYKNAYIVGVNAYDELDEVQINNQRTVGKPVFDWDSEEVNFNTDVRIQGNLRLKGDGYYGNTLYFGDGSYAYMSENTDDDLTFHASDITLEATNLNMNGKLLVNCGGYYQQVGEQKDLATGINKFMHGTQSYDLIGSAALSKQLNGYILVWSYYSGGTTYANCTNYTFVPKCVLNFHNGYITMPVAMDDGTVCAKSFEITETNGTTKLQGVAANGTAPNNKLVLNKIMGY